MKRLIIIITAFCAFGLHAQAQTMQFLTVNSDAASAAVASTGVARTADAFAVNNNMAAVAFTPSGFSSELGYGIWQPHASKSSIISAAAFLKVSEKIAVGIDFKNFDEAEYSIISADGRSNGTFKPSEMAAGLGVSYKLSDNLALGVNAKFATSSLAESAKGTGISGGVSLAYVIGGFQAGLAVDNLGGKGDYSPGNTYSIPSVAKAGVSYTVAGLTASGELDYLFCGGLMAGLGAEYWVKDVVSVRAGFHYGDNAKAIPSYASAGLGFNLAGVRINAAYLLGSDIIGGSMMFGLGYSF